ncbi:hypothetical protein SHT69_13385 (plasmid) [Enterococcus faecalis]|uniref:hypothetical protein n=1 Tax=Enterococcus faecalis TaxID=1351 RepID=UPI0029C7D8B9|nr:hypothetical protein [Enterococcus faecalis]WPH53470.1 hypothetical protein SHT69_13385 [Enterococcus faecalis]
MIKKKIFNCKYGQPLGYKLNKVDKIFYKELTTEDEATRWATEYYSNWSATYDETYRSNKIGMFTTYVYSYDPIRFYCGHIAERLNSLLRNKKGLLQSLENEQQTQRKSIVDLRNFVMLV